MTIQIAHIPVDVDGSKVEPEQQPALRTLQMKIPVSAGVAGPNGPIETQKIGEQVATIKQELSAGELAERTLKCCSTCRSFSKEKMGPILRDHAKRNDLESGLVATGCATVESAPRVAELCGYCKRNGCIVHPEARCDAYHAIKMGDDLDIRSRRYDEIMAAASGKKVRDDR